MKKVLHLISSVFFVSIFAFNSYANESTAASIVGNLASSLGDAVTQNPSDSSNSAQQTTNETTLPKMDDLLASENAVTKDVSKPSEMRTSSNGVSTTQPAVAGNSRPKFIASDGTVYTPPEGFSLPPEMKEGWFYLTTNIDALKTKLAAMPPVPDNNPVATQGIPSSSAQPGAGQQNSSVSGEAVQSSNGQIANGSTAMQQSGDQAGSITNGSTTMQPSGNQAANIAGGDQTTMADLPKGQSDSYQVQVTAPGQQAMNQYNNPNIGNVAGNEQLATSERSINPQNEQIAGTQLPTQSSETIMQKQAVPGQATYNAAENMQANGAKKPIMFQCYLA